MSIQAKFTKLFNSWLLIEKDEQTYESKLLSVFDVTGIDKNKLLNMIKSIFRYHEIGSDDDDEFYQFMTDVFNENKDYYIDLITNYSKAYDYATNNKRTVSRSDTYSKSANVISSNSGNNEHTEYELPNKITDDSYKNAPSSISTDDNSGSTSSSTSGNTVGTSTTIYTYDNELLDLKRKYINQIRNVYEEFANKFKECFIMIY